ncbi:MAG: deoxyribose-phosphate aldolase [Candidatus Bathyarchaeota archaeon]|nr:deoxyribose-phosphate aldolase [Candidatus Bathyarchaeota archaeon]MDI6805237.1 deoxyribose-phosphate aldolase [Candidatus Bathyarchaeia archaeon]
MMRLKISREELAKMIDSTNVKAAATKKEIEKLCKEAIKYGFRCAVVNPFYVKFAAKLLKDSDVKVCSTVGFPFGVSLPEIKALEAVKAVEDDAEELDMVINLSALKSGDYDFVKQDIKAVLDAKRLSNETIVKVIIETAYLTKDEKILACKLVKEAGADFVKTSTGLFGKGATIEDVKLMRQTVGKDMGVKAAGGIRTYADAIAFIEAGANRIGTSTATAIIKEASS